MRSQLGGNYLDLLLSSDITQVENVEVGEPFKTSDHHIIRFNLLCSKMIHNTKTPSFNYYNANYDDIRNYIQTLNLNQSSDDEDVDSMWGHLKLILLDIRNKFIPLRKKKKNKCKWITRKASRNRKAKKKAWNKYIQSGKNKTLYHFLYYLLISPHSYISPCNFPCLNIKLPFM